MKNEIPYGVTFRDNSLYIYFSASYQYKIEAFPSCKCWKLRYNGKWKRKHYYDLNINNRSVLFFGTEIGDEFLASGKYKPIPIYDNFNEQGFPKTSRKRGMIFREWNQVYGENAKQQIDKFFNLIPTEIAQEIGKFPDCDGLQNRLLQNVGGDIGFLNTIKYEPFEAYVRVMKEINFIEEIEGESSSANEFKESNLEAYRKLSPECLDFRLFPTFNLLINSDVFSALIRNLKCISYLQFWFLRYAQINELTDIGIPLLFDLELIDKAKVFSQFCKDESFFIEEQERRLAYSLVKELTKCNSKYDIGKIEAVQVLFDLVVQNKNGQSLSSPLNIAENYPFLLRSNLTSKRNDVGNPMDCISNYPSHFKRAIFRDSEVNSSVVIPELEFNDSEEVIGYGVKFINNFLYVYLDTFQSYGVEGDIRTYRDKSYFYAIEAFPSLQIWEREYGDYSWKKRENLDKDFLRYLLDEDHSPGNAIYGYSCIVPIMKRKDIFDFHLSNHSYYYSTSSDADFIHFYNLLQIEILKFRLLIPQCFLKMLRVMDRKNSNNELGFFGRYTGKEFQRDIYNRSLNFKWRLLVKAKSDLNFLELSLNLPNISCYAICIYEYEPTRKSKVLKFADRELYFNSLKSILKAFGFKNEHFSNFLKLTLGSIRFLRKNEYRIILNQKQNGILMNSVIEIPVWMTRLLLLSSIFRYNNLSLNLLNGIARHRMYILNRRDKELEETDYFFNEPVVMEEAYITVSSKLENGEKITSLKKLSKLFKKYNVDETDDSQDYNGNHDFAKPPLNGNENIFPITNSFDLYFEGLVQRHCCYSYEDEILAGCYYIYRMNFPERCTIGIRWISDQCRWEIDQIQTRSNNEASETTEAIIYRWFESIPRESLLPFDFPLVSNS